SLTERFKQTGIEGEIAVCRECLIDGDVKADTLDEFWSVRSSFLGKTYGDSDHSYSKNVANEFRKLQDLQTGDEVNLWFEHELFCQVNMWFCLSQLEGAAADVYRVQPQVDSESDKWKGFGDASADDLKPCFAERKKFSDEDIRLGTELWDAYRTNDHARLKNLAEQKSPCFLYLKEVCEAAIEKDIRPKQILAEISNGEPFNEIFTEFSKRAGVYGFGDSQVKRLLQSI
ncbi:MAG: DUF1835 domain-containing protein, partial [Saprospiraceae bacterium]|nr:DUF1835 domain-containing protein [Pyrinomonadaceae bacterium]